MKKLLATLTAVAMLATSTVAFADVVANDDGYNKTAGTYSVDADLSEVSGQLTLLIIPEAAYLAGEVEDEDILYIDQGAYADGLFQSVGILGGTELEAGTYYAKIGGTGLENIIVESFTVGADHPDYPLGDADLSGVLSSNDALTALKAVVGSLELTGDALKCADADKSGVLSSNDALTILKAVVSNGVLEW